MHADRDRKTQRDRMPSDRNVMNVGMIGERTSPKHRTDWQAVEDGLSYRPDESSEPNGLAGCQDSSCRVRRSWLRDQIESGSMRCFV